MIQVKDGDRILFLGDSITDVKFNRRQHKNLGGKKIYAKQVAEQLKKQHKNLTFFYKGIASNRSYHVYDRLTRDCMALKPDVLVLLIGVNDAWETFKPEDFPPQFRPFEPHMQEIFRRIHMELPQTKVILLLPFLVDTIEEKEPFHAVLEGYYETLKQLSRGVADVIIELQPAFTAAEKQTEPYLLSHDGIHPTELGHSVIAKEILKVLN